MGYKSFFPYFRLLGSDWLPFVGALFCGLLYGASSGFGLPFMIDQVFPKIFPDQSNSPTLSNFELFYLISWFPLVFLVRGTSGYFNSYLINYCGLRVLEKIRLQVFAKVQKLPISFFQKNVANIFQIYVFTTQINNVVTTEIMINDVFQHSVQKNETC